MTRGSARSIILSLAALLAPACAAPPAPLDRPPALLELPPPPPAASSPSPPPTAPHAPPPAAAPVPDPPRRALCNEHRCDADAMRRCQQTDELRLAEIDELAECVAKEAADTNYPKVLAYFRRAMLDFAFRDGALLPGAGDRLVRAGVLTAPQAKALAGAPKSRGAGSASCSLAEGVNPGEVELTCATRGACVGGCRRQLFERIVRVDAGGRRAVRVSVESVDDGSCGCCK